MYNPGDNVKRKSAMFGEMATALDGNDDMVVVDPVAHGYDPDNLRERGTVLVAVTSRITGDTKYETRKASRLEKLA